MTQVIGIGLSGGADSSYAAYRLIQQGYSVQGFTMQFGAQAAPTADKARHVAEKLGIPHTILQLEDVFEQTILQPFAEAYAHGLTPSPCVWCNAKLKFGLMADAIRQAGCPLVATGHYVRYSKELGLRRGTDNLKDQSYFLAQLRPEQLADTLFPLGDCQKVQVTAEALRLGLIATDEGESQDLCFLPDGDFADFVLKRFPDLQKPGSILDSNGKVLGVHQGAFRYTRGQRKGLGLGGGPWFVLQTDLQKNTVTIGHAEETLAQTVSLDPDTMNWLIPPEQRPKPGQPLNCTAQIRYRMRAKNAVLLDNTLSFTENISAVTPGQLAVCYRDDQVIASGFIL